jgi:type III restriction enzyme
VPGSKLSTNFLIVAPNVIVYQRLEKDFASNRIFHELPLVPPEWRGAFEQKVILRGEATEPDASGNLFLTNIHQLYESCDQEWTPQNAVEALLGKKPAKDLAAGQRSMLERIKSLKDLVVFSENIPTLALNIFNSHDRYFSRAIDEGKRQDQEGPPHETR